ncbi:DUF692 domain-containing protein [uncultured Ferrovibrio sp.]|jgi:uncharacterized protein (UPF0276 family)|uniref:MNIO family bufferin maturase n=1 Tax=uncultured Ferrovibrio sp. TaxID=1576913 RepID=UPI00262260A7|nr:DUF692 domain-containing protein [uncultured Ferrovibrio sp.]
MTQSSANPAHAPAMPVLAGGDRPNPGRLNPDRAGIGLRAPHHRALLELRPAVGWVEIHAENYMGGGAPRYYLEQARAIWPVSVHGVGLGLGGSELPDAAHLERLAALVEWLEPVLVSEHLAWVGVDGRYYNDLLPIPYTDESLELASRNIDIVQARLKRPILIETPATYLRFRESHIAEAEFLSRLSTSTGCGILCDVNNIYVSSVNHVGREAAPAVAEAYLDSLPPMAVHELHVAGHTEIDADGQTILIDDHGSLVAEPVWRLYASAVRRFPHAATLLEWDVNIPPLPHLVAEAEHADRRRVEALAALAAPTVGQTTGDSDERAA